MDNAQYRLASELIQKIFYSVSHPEGWQDAVAAIAEACNADGCIIWMTDVHHPELDLLATSYQDTRKITEYRQNYTDKSPLNRRLREVPPDRFYTSEQLIPREEFIQTPMYREFWKSSGIEYSMGGYIAREGNRVAVTWVYRGPGQPFSE